MNTNAAGPSGLATAAELRRRGLAFDHVERHDGVGGLWDFDNPTTPMYESAHFISSKRLSCFPGRPFDSGVADYPPRVEILRYLREFAAEEGLSDGIRFGVEVTGIARDGAGYAVTFAGEGAPGTGMEPRNGTGPRTGPRTATRTYRHVICASGTLSVPVLPDIPGDFDGDYRHSATYRSIDELRGKRVLIIGAGNSGCDIALLADEATGTGDLARTFLDRAATRSPDLSGGLAMDSSDRHRGYADSHALHAALAAEMEELGLDPQRDKLGGLAG